MSDILTEIKHRKMFRFFIFIFVFNFENGMAYGFQVIKPLQKVGHKQLAQK